MLNGEVTIVTGGCRGLGKAMAMALLGAGGCVVVTGTRDPAALAATEAEASEGFGPGRLVGVTADVTSPSDCDRTVDVALQSFGRLDALINNAGRGMRVISETFNTKPVAFWDIEPAKWSKILDINVDGSFLMARAVMPHFLKQGRGRVINISTSDQTMIRRGYAPYGPSKAALEAMSRCWSQDVEGTGVTVNVLLPGGASATDLLPAGPNQRGADGNLLDPALMGPPSVWLVSDASRAHNGQRFIARLWDPALPIEEAVSCARSASVARPAIM